MGNVWDVMQNVCGICVTKYGTVIGEPEVGYMLGFIILSLCLLSNPVFI